MKPIYTFLLAFAMWVAAGNLHAHSLAGGDEPFFVRIKLGNEFVTDRQLPADKVLTISQGNYIALFYKQGEVVNRVKVSTQGGEVLLDTRSLDDTIYLQTKSLTPGEYVIEVGSAGQASKGKLVVI